MKVILFTNARDEKHIKEWVAHHLNLGFDFIYIFDHKSLEPIEAQFKQNPKIKIERIDKLENIKNTCMKKAVILAKGYDWMIYLDADEFLVLNNHTTIQEFILSYNDINQIILNWVFFGSNFLSTEPQGMMLENYIRCHAGINKHVKSLVRPNTVIDIYNAHVYKTNNPNKSRSCYNSIQMDIKEPWFISIPNKSYCDIPAYVAHYVNQAYNKYKERRLSRQRDDGTPITRIYTEQELHNIDNTLINTTVRDKYCQQNAELIKTL
jgi:hypothetical protein